MFGLTAVVGLLVRPRLDYCWITVLVGSPSLCSCQKDKIYRTDLSQSITQTSEPSITTAPACHGLRSWPASISPGGTCSSLVDLPQDYCISSRNLHPKDIFSPQSTQKYYRLNDFILIMKTTFNWSRDSKHFCSLDLVTNIKLLFTYLFNIYLLSTSSAPGAVFSTEARAVKAYSLAGAEPNIKQSYESTHTSFEASLRMQHLFVTTPFISKTVSLKYTHSTLYSKHSIAVHCGCVYFPHTQWEAAQPLEHQPPDCKDPQPVCFSAETPGCLHPRRAEFCQQLAWAWSGFLPRASRHLWLYSSWIRKPVKPTELPRNCGIIISIALRCWVCDNLLQQQKTNNGVRAWTRIKKWFQNCN